MSAAPTPTCRLLVAADVPALAELYQRELAEWQARGGWEPATAAQARLRISLEIWPAVAREGVGYGVQDGGRWVAVNVWRWGRLAPEQPWLAHELWCRVEPERRGQGWARALRERCQATLRGRAAAGEEIWWLSQTGLDNAPMRRCLERAGMEACAVTYRAQERVK